MKENFDNFDEIIIVSELADENLWDFIKRHQGFLPEEIILKIFIQISLGLNYLHT